MRTPDWFDVGVAAFIAFMVAIVLFAACNGIWDMAAKAGRAHCMNHPQDSECQAELEQKK